MGQYNFGQSMWILANPLSARLYYLCIFSILSKFQGDQSWVQVTPGVILSNVTPLNNLLFNSYFENSFVELHILYILNMHANFHANQM